MAQLRGNVLQALTVAQQQAREGVTSVVQPAPPDFCSIARFPIDPVPPVVHVEQFPFLPADRLSFHPHDVAWAEEYRVRDRAALPSFEVLSLTLFFQGLKLGDQDGRNVDRALLPGLSLAVPAASELTPDQQRLIANVQIRPLQASRFSGPQSSMEQGQQQDIVREAKSVSRRL